MQSPFLHHIYARKFPNLVSLDGERLKLLVSAQKALLESMAVPKAAFEVPESKRWLENFDWEDSNSNTKENNMMDENFISNVTRKQTSLKAQYRNAMT